jgi:transcriptional regulator with XRE-family HTH domain
VLEESCRVQLLVHLGEVNLDTPSERIKHIRGSLTQTEFAERLGVHKNTIGRYERGDGEPDIGVASKMCLIFGFDPNWLLFGEGPMRRGEAAESDMDAVAVGQAPVAPPASELEELRRDNRELRQENRELRNENRELIRENRDLSVELAQLKPRAAPAEELPAEDARKSA